MNKNQNIAMGISLAVVAIMVGSAEIFGEKEIIFPEITAVAMGALIAPVQSWNTSRTRLFAAIVSVAVAGVCIVRFIPEMIIPVSYNHLTLPTSDLLLIPVGSV